MEHSPQPEDFDGLSDAQIRDLINRRTARNINRRREELISDHLIGSTAATYGGQVRPGTDFGNPEAGMAARFEKIGDIDIKPGQLVAPEGADGPTALAFPVPLDYDAYGVYDLVCTLCGSKFPSMLSNHIGLNFLSGLFRVVGCPCCVNGNEPVPGEDLARCSGRTSRTHGHVYWVGTATTPEQFYQGLMAHARLSEADGSPEIVAKLVARHDEIVAGTAEAMANDPEKRHLTLKPIVWGHSAFPDSPANDYIHSLTTDHSEEKAQLYKIVESFRTELTALTGIDKSELDEEVERFAAAEFTSSAWASFAHALVAIGYLNATDHPELYEAARNWKDTVS